MRALKKPLIALLAIMVLLALPIQGMQPVAYAVGEQTIVFWIIETLLACTGVSLASVPNEAKPGLVDSFKNSVITTTSRVAALDRMSNMGNNVLGSLFFMVGNNMYMQAEKELIQPTLDWVKANFVLGPDNQWQYQAASETLNMTLPVSTYYMEQGAAYAGMGVAGALPLAWSPGTTATREFALASNNPSKLIVTDMTQVISDTWRRHVINFTVFYGAASASLAGGMFSEYYANANTESLYLYVWKNPETMKHSIIVYGVTQSTMICIYSDVMETALASIGGSLTTEFDDELSIPLNYYPPITQTGVIPGTLTLPFSDVLPKPLVDTGTLTQPLAIAVPTTIAIEIADTLDPTAEPPTDVYVPPNINTWQLPTAIFKKFPFCIPWDLYNMFAALNAPGKAPKWTIDLPMGIVTAPVTIDMAQWNDVAAVMRSCCLVLFVILLAVGSRRLIGAV